MSTGQGLLGNNMFAYCGNSPTNDCDYAGTISVRAAPNTTYYEDILGGGGGGGGAVLLPGLIDAVDEAATGALLAVSYAYRSFTRSVKANTYGMLPGNYPVTHHIIPYGDFGTRSKEVNQQLREAQEIMIRAGVIPQSNRVNQLVLSASYHASLHTDEYIKMVTAPIVDLGDNATEDQIYAILFDFRIVIAANDPYAYGY